MKRGTAIYLSVVLPVAVAILTIMVRVWPEKSLPLVALFIVLLSICWLTSIFIVVRPHNENKLNEIERTFYKCAEEMNKMLYDYGLTQLYSWIVSDSKLSQEYETLVPPAKAIVVVTPTFLNDYPWNNISTYASNVAGNIIKGVKYRYVAEEQVAEKHFDKLMKYHRVKLSALGKEMMLLDSIKVIVTSVPQITEMVFYPLEDEAAFTIIKTEDNPANKNKPTEYNVKMVANELELLKQYLKYLLNHKDTHVWEFDSATGRVIRAINSNDKQEFYQLTGVFV